MDSVDEGVDVLNQVFTMLETSGYTEDQVLFDQTIARGLDYYTGIIYETTLKQAARLGSVCSGGRFDNLVEALGGPSLPAVGTSIGVDRLYDGLKELGKLKESKTVTEVLITNFNMNSAPVYMNIASCLRRAGIASEVYYDDSRLKKQLSFANKIGIPYVVLVGSDELERNSAIIKTLETGEQVEVPLEELSGTITKLKNNDL